MASLLRRARGHKGAALIEVALTLPLLLLVSVGIFEFGRAYQTWQVLTNAAREGARVAVLPDSTDDAVEDRARAYMESGSCPSPTPPRSTSRTTPTSTPAGGICRPRPR